MKRPWSAGLVALLLAAPAGAERTPDALDAWLERERAAGTLASAAVARIDGADVEFAGIGHRDGEGGAAPTPQTRFQWGSITKVFTHLLLAEMVAAGEVRYESTLAELLPATAQPRNPAVGSISLEALSTHRSGLPRLPPNLDLRNITDPYGSFDADDLQAAVQATRDRQRLTGAYVYSNFGVGLLGFVLGEREGHGYRRAVKRRVIDVLQLEHASFEPGDDAAAAISGGKRVEPWRFDALAAAGALWGSTADLARLVQMHLGTQPWPLKHELAADLAIIAPAGPFDITRVWHVARAGDQPIYWHNGGTAGFHSFVGFRPDLRTGIAILASGDADPTDAALRSLGAGPARAAKTAIDASVLGQYTLAPDFGIGVFERGGVLLAQASGQPAFALHAAGDDWYASGDVDASLHLVRNEGRVAALELVQNGIVQHAPRTADTATVARRSEIAVAAERLQDYVGEYAFSPGATLTVRVTDGALDAQLTGQSYFPVYPAAEDRFFYKVVDAELVFEREQGRVTGVVLHQGGTTQRAARR